MKKSYIALALSVVVATASCRRSEQETPDRASQTLALTIERSDFESQFAAEDSVNKMLQRAFSTSKDPLAGDGNRSITRAGETAFEANDSIGLYVHTTATLGTTGIHTPNICYATYDGATWTAEGYLSDILKSGTTYHATAYYPFVRQIIDPTKVTHSVAADQTSRKSFTMSDLMFSAPVTVVNPSTAPAIALSFKHLLSKVTAKFTIPSLLDGAVVTGVDRVVVKSVDRAVSVSLSDGTLSSPGNKGDIKLLHASGTIAIGEEVTYEGIVIPQTIAKGARMVEIYFTTASGEKSYTYALDTELVLTGNLKHTFTLVSIGDLCFTSVLDLTDGLAHSYMPLKIKSLPGIEWTLLSGAEWMKLSLNTTDTPSASIKGTGTGSEQTIYVSVTANTSMIGNFWEPRAAVLTLDLASKGVKSTYTALQNFYRFELETVSRKVDAARSVVGVEGFGANQVWSAASGADWIKLASSVVYGEGSPAASYGPVNGSLTSGTVFYQIEANNTDVARTGTVVFTPTTAGGKGAAVTFEQAAGSVRVSTTKVMLSGAAATGVRMFDLTVSQGLKWKILSASGVTTIPAVGVEQTGLGTPLEIKGSWAANNTTEIISGSVVIAYGAYGATQQRTIEITQAPQFIVLNGLRWATGNLVASGVNGASIGSPTDGGLYFQYGGLIGYKGGDKGDGTGFPTFVNNKFWDNAAAFSSNDVAITPAGYLSGTTKWPFFENMASGGFGYYYYNNFVTEYADFQSQANGKDVALGIGDPCAHYLGGTWRLPRYDELSAITGSSLDGNWVAWSNPLITGRWMRPSSTHSVDGAWFGPNSRSKSPAVNTDLFIPASGRRNNSNGAFWQVGTNGYLWSSSVYGYFRGFDLAISESSGVYSRDVLNRTSAFPVRCVQDVPTEPNPPTPDQIVTINGLKWTTGNLVANGGANCKIGAPGDAGLYFQYGGLVGYKGGANGDGTGITNAATHTDNKWWGGAAAYSANDVAVAPATYATKATWPYFDNVAVGGFGYYYFNTFVTKYADFQAQANANNPTLGIGDPCTYYLGSPWRLPKYDELSAITGSSTEGSWVKWTVANVTGKWSNSGPQSTKGAWFGPNSRSGTPTTDTDLFFPASGLRSNSDGSFRYVGTYGYLLSSSVYDYRYGLNLAINESSGVYPRAPVYNRAYGFSVRCVQDVPTKPNPPTPDQIVTINGLKWAKGNLVANGENFCVIGKPGDAGLYFQYGGLIGYKGGANGDGTGITNATTHPNGKYWGGAAAYSANDVAVAPATYATKATWPYFDNNAVGGFGYYYFNTFVTKYADFQAQANANNPTLGIGDPCTYYLDSPWRLPTVYELSAITGSFIEEIWAPWSTAGVTGRWSNSGPQSTKGAWFGPNSRSGTPTTDTDLFIPASGSRYLNSGAFHEVGINGDLWSSSVFNNRYTFALGINESSGVYPRAGYYRALGFPVRCVQDVPTEPNPPTPDQIVTINGLKWTKGNLVANGGANCKVGAPGDAGLYFQYGGLVGYKGGANGDGTGITNATTHPNDKWWGGTAAYSANDVAVAPATYATKATWPDFTNVASGGFGYYYFNRFITKYADFQAQANANNPTLGIGDPCAHYIGNGWRLPKYDELSAITGSSTEGAWAPWATAEVTGKWVASGPQSTMGAWFGPNSRSGTPTTNTDLFIPASGHRTNGNGAFYHVGKYGYLWSSSVYDYRSGFALNINESSGVYPRGWYLRANAFPVRCVQDVPTKPNPPTPDQIVTINGLKWTKGNLVADGANGCKIGAPGDGGLYFQYGGLVGYKGGANGDGRGITNAANDKWWGGAAAYSANDVAVAPATYATKATWPYSDNVASGGFGYYYFNTFATKYMDFQSQANANNPTLGIGDPCTYYLGSPWRLPKYDELSAITGSSTEEAWALWSTAGVTGRWSNSGPQSTKGAWFGPNSRSGTPTTDTDLFIPASGYRYSSDGTFYDVGISGYLWSSSVYDYRRGFTWYINESAGVCPRAGLSRAFGFPVRCVAN